MKTLAPLGLSQLRGRVYLHESACVFGDYWHVKKFQVLCLDECTANVDTQTASVLQSTIFSECRAMTVITIAHRISTVSTMDNILVLDRGNLVFLFSVSFLQYTRRFLLNMHIN